MSNDFEVERGLVSTGAPWGNFPQAFGHIGVVNAAWAIGEAQWQRSTDG